MNILIACEFSGIMRDSFIAKDHNAISCDLIPSLRPGPHLQCNVIDLLNQGWDMMIAHPPCDRLLSSGALHWYKWQQSGDQQRAIEFYLTLWNAPIPKICIENPVGIMSTIIGKPQYIQPWQFGHMESKKTGLHLKRLPELVPTNNVYTEMMKLPKHIRESVHYESPGIKNGLTRSQRRAITYAGIANAMAEQWG